MGIAAYTQSFPWLSRRKPAPFIRALYQLGRLIRDHNVRIVHTNCDRSVKYAIPVARWLRVPCICHVRDFQRAWHQPDYISYLNHATAIVTISTALEQHCVREGMRADKTISIYDGIDTAQYARNSPQTASNVRRESGIPATAPVIGMVGQVLPLKGQWEFVQAARLIAAQYPAAHFVIVGSDDASPDPTYLPRLTEYVRSAGLEPRVHFTGFRKNVPDYIAAFDILALPTHDEAFGRVVVEGMAAGKPVVASRVGGVTEIIEHDRTGCLVPVKDVVALAQTILGLLADPARCIMLGEAARQAAGLRFDLADSVKHFEALYAAVRDARSNWRFIYENRSLS
jgi:glycosyltransferase involved in cell wall biosynthesis